MGSTLGIDIYSDVTSTYFIINDNITNYLNFRFSSLTSFTDVTVSYLEMLLWTNTKKG